MSSDIDVRICLQNEVVRKIGAVTRDETRLTGEFLWADGDQAALERVMAARSTGENFPVAVRLLPARQRRQLMAVYGFARVTDDIGDQAPPAERLRLAWTAVSRSSR